MDSTTVVCTILCILLLAYSSGMHTTLACRIVFIGALRNNNKKVMIMNVHEWTDFVNKCHDAMYII